jgi:hypothetical protein
MIRFVYLHRQHIKAAVCLFKHGRPGNGALTKQQHASAMYKKKIMLLPLLLLCATFVLGQPKLKLDSPAYNLGIIKKRELAFTITRQFFFTNAGNKPLVITDLRTSFLIFYPGKKKYTFTLSTVPFSDKSGETVSFTVTLKVISKPDVPNAVR